MTRDNSSPDACVRVRPAHTLPALAAFAIIFFASAHGASAQGPSARPVARMIGATTVRERIASAAPSSAAASTRAESVRPAARGFAANSFEQRAFALVNAERRERGQEPLRWDAEASRVAREHSENMARRNFFSHTDPDGADYVRRAAAGGVTGWRALAENIAYNQGFDDPAAFAVERWMLSSKHRENILRQGFTHAGIGVARAADGRVFFTQVFISR
ncbi:MAG: CAP domain-containing protein [Acidobacteria bacterium]|nr:CAP domain-containing protein [Acidobacteriota bacterium]